MKKKEDVSTPTASYESHQELCAGIHTLMEGTQAMRKAGTKYLPREMGEEQSEYEARVKRTVLLNMMRRTLHKLTGEVFRIPVVIPAETPENFMTWLKDIDLNGNSLNEFAYSVFLWSLADGVGHILVDLPEIETTLGENGNLMWFNPETAAWVPITETLIKEKGWRPSWSHVKSEDLIGAQWGKDENGLPKLLMVRIKETTEEPADQWGTKTVERIRVLRPNSWQIWEQDKKGNWIIVKEGVTNFDFVPLVTFMPGEMITRATANPPLLDLSELNIRHWQSSSDQNNILHYARLVIWFGKFLPVDENGKIKWKASGVINADSADADLKAVEHNGTAIDSGKEDLERLERQMAAFGLTYMMPRDYAETATGRALDAAESDSILKAWAISFEEIINQAMRMTAEVMGLEVELPTVVINKEFKSMLETVDADLLYEMHKDQKLPLSVLVNELKRRGIISRDEDIEDWKIQIEADRKAGLFGTTPKIEIE